MIFYAIFITMGAGDLQRQTSELKMTIEDSAREGLYKMAQEIRLSAPGRVTITSPSTGYDIIQFQIPNSATPVNTNVADTVTDYTTDWTTAQTIQYARGGTSCDQIVRSTCPGGACPATTCPTAGSALINGQNVVANDVAYLHFDNTSNTNVVVAEMNVQRQIYVQGQRNLMVNSSGASAPLVMTAKARLRNS